MMSLRLSSEQDGDEAASASASTSFGTNRTNQASTQRLSQGFQAWNNGGDETQKRIREELSLGRLDLDSSPLSTAAASALLQHMGRIRAAGELPNSDQVDLDISRIETLALDQCLYINQDTRSALGIFNDESHSTFHSSQVQEGLSLFGEYLFLWKWTEARQNQKLIDLSHLAAIFDQTRTPISRSLLRRWFLFPSLDLDVIKGRHSAIECFLSVSNSEVIKDLGKALKGMKNIPKLVSIFKRGTASAKDFQSMLQNCFKCLLIREGVRSLEGVRNVEVFRKVLQTFDREAFQTILEQIEMVVDFDESYIERRVAVKSGVEEGLDQLKQSYASLPSMLDSVANQLRSSVPPGNAAR